jgi:hypothetical protein
MGRRGLLGLPTPFCGMITARPGKTSGFGWSMATTMAQQTQQLPRRT